LDGGGERNDVPHIVIECSDNVRTRTDLADLLESVHATALGTGVFPEGGIRTRIAERRDYRIADSDPANAFVHVTLRIGSGRDAETKRRAAQTVFETVCRSLQAAYETTPLSISLELQEIDPDLSFKKNNIHDYVKLRRTAVER
jgi:5-carboxymethyl-2-hydroxymuconate isomerase